MPTFTLLEIVNKVLDVVDGTPVNSISDTQEAEDIAGYAEDVYWDIVTNRRVPEHEQLFQLTSLSDSATPTHFLYPTNTQSIRRVDFNYGTALAPSYKEIDWLSKEEFLAKVDARTSNYTVVQDPLSGTYLKIRNDTDPTYYTSFDDQYIVMDSHDSTVDTTLPSAKTRAFGVKYPTFDQTTDTFVPDIDENMFPYYIREVQSMSMSLLKGEVNPKVEGAARRNKVYLQNDRTRTRHSPTWTSYGRN